MRRAWWRGEAMWAALVAAFALGASVLTGAGAWTLATAAEPVAGGVVRAVVVGVLSAYLLAASIRWAIPYWLSIVAGEEAIDIAAPTATGRRVTVWRRGVIRTWQKSFDMTDDAVVVTPARRAGLVAWLEGMTPTVGVIGGLRVDGAEAAWECRIGPGISTSLADRLVRALGGTGDVPWLTLRIPTSG